MKCPDCRSCARLIRIDTEEGTFINWYCSLCKKVFTMSSKKNIEKDSEVYKLTVQKYEEIYGANKIF